MPPSIPKWLDTREIKTKLFKFVLLFQGLYYSITGLWAIVALNNFYSFTRGSYEEITPDHKFVIFANAAFFVAIGIFLLLGGIRKGWMNPAIFVALAVAIAVMVAELIYLPQIGNPVLFWLDFVEEAAVASVLGFLIVLSKYNKSTKGG